MNESSTSDSYDGDTEKCDDDQNCTYGFEGTTATCDGSNDPIANKQQGQTFLVGTPGMAGTCIRFVDGIPVGVIHCPDMADSDGEYIPKDERAEVLLEPSQLKEEYDMNFGINGETIDDNAVCIKDDVLVGDPTLPFSTICPNDILPDEANHGLGSVYGEARSETPVLQTYAEYKRITPVKTEENSLDPLTPTTNLKTLANITLLHTSRLDESSGYYSMGADQLPQTDTDTCDSFPELQQKPRRAPVKKERSVRKGKAKKVSPQSIKAPTPGREQTDENSSAGRKLKSLGLLCDR